MMEAWPTVSLFLLLSNIADSLKTVQSRDFSMTDIVLLHPSTTPHPGGFKCFTCEAAADNYQCNRWAPDVYCPKDARYCSTVHTMDSHGDSLSVTKRCVALEDCQVTGCAHVTENGSQVCTSCCQGNICNVLVPRNQSSAVFSSSSTLLSSSTRTLPLATPLGYVVFISICISSCTFTAGLV